MAKGDWDNLGVIAGVVGGLTTLHGLTSKKWTDAHTATSALSVMAIVGAWLSRS